MADSNHYGSNLMQNYFLPDSAIHQVIGGLQRGQMSFDVGTINKARSEVQRKSVGLDASTYPFTDDFARYFFNNEKSRVIMFVEGVFHGNTDLATVIPIDLGPNPHQLFEEPHGNTTIDSTVTFDQTTEYLHSDHFRSANAKTLENLGAYEFEVQKSRFFYLMQPDLEDMFGRQLKRGEAIAFEEMALLVPTLISTDYIVLTETKAPSKDAQTPMHVSYRLKQSLEAKLLDRLRDGPYKPGSKVRLIADWVAHRPVLPTIEDVYALEAFLRSNPTIGNSRVEYLYTNNYYIEEPKKGSGRQFKALNVIVKVTTSGHESALREIQIVDAKQYSINELQKGEERHDELEKKRGNVPRKERDARKKNEEVLDQIFIQENDFVPL